MASTISLPSAPIGAFSTSHTLGASVWEYLTLLHRRSETPGHAHSKHRYMYSTASLSPFALLLGCPMEVVVSRYQMAGGLEMSFSQIRNVVTFRLDRGLSYVQLKSNLILSLFLHFSALSSEKPVQLHQATHILGSNRPASDCGHQQNSAAV